MGVDLSGLEVGVTEPFADFIEGKMSRLSGASAGSGDESKRARWQS